MNMDYGKTPKRPPSFILIAGIIAAIVLFVGLNHYMQGDEAGQHDHAGHVHDENCDHDHNGVVDKVADEAPVTKEQSSLVEVVTDKGTFRIKLYDGDMPITTKNFKMLVEKEFYDGLTFHRVEDWVVQGGDPLGTGIGGAQDKIRLEINENVKWNKPGQVGMARAQPPDSASSQWFVVTQAAEWLNPSPQSAGYALFGEVIDDGMDVVNKLERGDKMQTVRLIETEAEEPAEAEAESAE